ncbi:MAG TPA: gluconokinase, GntK/IdnK-type [Rhodanobacter sp.]|nr:gluconokinase, GntK/IdnK-type [Rhodanobacter sp.]
MVIVVMGVSGSGKSSLAAALAEAEGWDFQEGDELHPPANIDKMRAGSALTDADREPWLDRVADWIGDELRQQRDGVISCSALRRRYRERLRQTGSNVRFVYIRVPRDELLRRLQQRDHFMPAALLDSQLHTLEEPVDECDVLTVTGEGGLQEILGACRTLLGRAAPH